MANGRTKKKGAVTVAGPWFAMPLNFLRSRAFAELSPHAAKMLLDLCSCLGANAYGNGDLSASPAIMQPKGWTSDATRTAALRELEAADLIVRTRFGNRRQCALYAVTLWPIQCDASKLEHGPGSFATSDWMKGGSDRAQIPTMEAPAKWNRPRKGATSAPATGQVESVMCPQREKVQSAAPHFDPSTGARAGFSGLYLVPPGDTYLDNHLMDHIAVGVAAGVRSTASLQ